MAADTRFWGAEIIAGHHRKALPQGLLIRQLNPTIWGWATSYRHVVSQAVYHRLDHLTWVKLRHWARWRHPRKSTAWAIRRYWHRRGARQTFATSATDPDAKHLRAHSQVSITRHVKVQGNRSPYDGDWVYCGARDKADTPMSGHDWPGCSKRNAVAVALVSCSSNMTTGSRWTIAMATTEMRALRTCKRSMDIATMRKRERTGTISRQVCVTSIEILRSGVHENGHAPIWNSGRRSDPLADCNRHNGTSRLRNQRQVRKTLAFSKAKRSHGWMSWLSVDLYNFCRPHSSVKSNQADQLTHRSPAMAAGVTDHLWSTREWLLKPILGGQR